MKKKYFLIIISVIIVAAILAGGQIFTVRHVSVVFHNKTGVATEADILDAAGLDYHNNIFGINEKEIKRRIAAAYADNSIAVTDIERSFPDTVTIYVKERVPIFLIKVESEEGNKFVPTDKDFQRGTVRTLGEIDDTLIKVTGFEISETFDVKECIILRKIANTLIGRDLAEEALPYFISEINFNENVVTVTVNGTGAKLMLSADATADEIVSVYNKYLALSNAERAGSVVTP